MGAFQGYTPESIAPTKPRRMAFTFNFGDAMEKAFEEGAEPAPARRLTPADVRQTIRVINEEATRMATKFKREEILALIKELTPPALGDDKEAAKAALKTIAGVISLYPNVDIDALDSKEAIEAFIEARKEQVLETTFRANVRANKYGLPDGNRFGGCDPNTKKLTTVSCIGDLCHDARVVGSGQTGEFEVPFVGPDTMGAHGIATEVSERDFIIKMRPEKVFMMWRTPDRKMVHGTAKEYYAQFGHINEARGANPKWSYPIEWVYVRFFVQPISEHVAPHIKGKDNTTHLELMPQISRIYSPHPGRTNLVVVSNVGSAAAPGTRGVNNMCPNDTGNNHFVKLKVLTGKPLNEDGKATAPSSEEEQQMCKDGINPAAFIGPAPLFDPKDPKPVSHIVGLMTHACEDPPPRKEVALTRSIFAPPPEPTPNSTLQLAHITAGGEFEGDVPAFNKDEDRKPHPIYGDLVVATFVAYVIHKGHVITPEEARQVVAYQMVMQQRFADAAQGGEVLNLSSITKKMSLKEMRQREEKLFSDLADRDQQARGLFKRARTE